MPLTSRIRGIPPHVRLLPPEDGVRTESAVMCDAIRSLAKDRLVARWGRVSAASLETIGRILRILLRL